MTAAVPMARGRGAQWGERGARWGGGPSGRGATARRGPKVPAGGDQAGHGHRGEGAPPEPEGSDEGPEIDDRPDHQRLPCRSPGEKAAGPRWWAAECWEVAGEPGVGVRVASRGRELVDGIVEGVG